MYKIWLTRRDERLICYDVAPKYTKKLFLRLEVVESESATRTVSSQSYSLDGKGLQLSLNPAEYAQPIDIKKVQKGVQLSLGFQCISIDVHLTLTRD